MVYTTHANSEAMNETGTGISSPKWWNMLIIQRWVSGKTRSNCLFCLNTQSVSSISHALYWIPHLKNEAQYGLHNHIAFPKNHTRQIDIIRPRPRVIFLSKYLTRLPCPDSHLVCVIKRKQKSNIHSIVSAAIWEKKTLRDKVSVCVRVRVSERGWRCRSWVSTV